jgi:6-phosphogluconolactonase
MLMKKISLPGPSASANLVLCEDLQELSETAADLQESFLTKKPFSIALSGGSTPRAFHEVLSKRNLDWNDVHFFWGDERCVPPDHKDSNYRMAHETLLQKIQVSDSQIHRMKGELEPTTAAQEYESELRKYFTGQNLPSFDLIYLGMGDDSHTASLFPGSEAVNISDRFVVSNYVEKLRSMRLTMTFPVLNAANSVVFLIAGEGKAIALKNVLTGTYNPQQCPSQRVRPERGELYFIVDRAAAGLLEKG